MARVPAISSPCPLRLTSMPTAGRDFCGQCSRRVHNLDGMSDAQRIAFFAACSGDVCVSYSVRRPGALAGLMGLGVAAAALLAATPADADETHDAGSSAASTVQPVVTGPNCDPKARTQPMDNTMILGGGVKAASVQWVDEHQAAQTARPPIAEVPEAEWLPTPADAE